MCTLSNFPMELSIDYILDDGGEKEYYKLRLTKGMLAIGGTQEHILRWSLIKTCIGIQISGIMNNKL